MIDLRSGEETFLEFDVPNQARWQVEQFFPDGRLWALWSQEPPKNPEADFGAKDGLAFARTHLWIYDTRDESVREIVVPTLSGLSGILQGGRRVLTYCNDGGTMTITRSDPDGSDQEVVMSKDGYGYCVTLSPDEAHAAYHITGVRERNPYEIFVVDLETGEEVLLASDPDHLNFGPEWSPDGEWILYQRCAHVQDPGHDHSDLCIGRQDGSEHRMLTRGKSHWFATSYGSPETRGGGSNIPKWSPDGRILTYTMLLPGSRTAWQYRVDSPDRDHFNRDYRPEDARGGTNICTIDPETGEIRTLTRDDPPIWNWRTEWSPDSREMLFSRAAVGCPSEVWVMDRGGGRRRFLTRGHQYQGADFARFVQG